MFRQLWAPPVVTMDIDPTLRPDVIGSVFEMPFADCPAFDARPVSRCWSICRSIGLARRCEKCGGGKSAGAFAAGLLAGLTMRIALRIPAKEAGWCLDDSAASVGAGEV